MAKNIVNSGLRQRVGENKASHSKSFSDCNAKKRLSARVLKGFTLVEVLITVGIIGVVAALTIPTIIQNSNNRKFASQFKKSMSTLSQAAIMSQAQYDSDYSSLNTASDSCDSESLAKSNLTMCGLFNSTLSGHTFLGMYGTAKGANASSVYQVSTKALPTLDENFMIFALADGAIVGFNKNATRCGVTPGTPMSADVLGTGGALANCVGFIDVNGPNSPNKEVTCKNADDTALNPSATCAPASAIGDVFPIVFHDGIVEPASNAARAVLSAGKGNPATGDTTGDDTASGGDSTPVADTTPKTANGHKIGKRDDPSTWEAFEIPTGLTYDECMAVKDSLGIKNCRSKGNDRWAAAVKECGGVQNMLTDDDLTAFAQELYKDCSTTNNGAPYCKRKTKPIPENLSGLGSEWFVLWSGSEYNSDNAYNRSFYSSSSQRGYDVRYFTGERAVCVEPTTE